MDKVTG